MTERSRQREIAGIAAVYAASRIVTLIAAWVVTLVRVDPTAADPTTRPHTLSQVLSTWDGHWYLDLALHGYPHQVPPGSFSAGTGAAAQNGLAFFPLYPLLLRCAHVVSPFSIDVDAVLLSMLLGLGATLGVWLLVRDRGGADAAQRSAALFCCFPGAFVLSFAYSEAAMVCAAVACLVLLGRGRWVWAGLAAALAGLARSPGLVLVPVCAWAAAVEIRRSRDLRALAAPLLAPLGVVGFFAYLRVHTGSWTTWFGAEKRGWGHHLDWGRAWAHHLGRFVTHPLHEPSTVIIGVCTIVAVLGLVALRITRRPGVEVLYSVVMLVLLASAPDLQIRPRFLFAAFPLVAALGAWTKPRWFPSVLAASTGAMGILTVLYGLRLTSPEILFP